VHQIVLVRTVSCASLDYQRIGLIEIYNVGQAHVGQCNRDIIRDLRIENRTRYAKSQLNLF
jgi:hypothetical protein